MSKTSTDYGAGSSANWGLSGERRFHSILVNSADPIICANARGEIIFVNRAAQRLFGYRGQELLGRKLSILMPDRYRGPHAEALAEYMATRDRRGSETLQEFHGLHRDGTEIPVEVSLSECETDGGTIFSASIRDLRGRLARPVDEKNGRRFHALIRVTRDPVLVLDGQGIVCDSNQAASNLLGFRGPEGVVGRPFAEFFVGQDVPRVQKCAVAPSFAGTGPQTGLRLRTRAGSEILVDLTMVSTDDAGAPEALAIVHDRTDSERARAECREREEKLQRTLRGTVAALSATVEIRDPYIAGHQARVSELALAIALEIGLPRSRAEGVRAAGALHDIGKIHLPPDILSKQATLTDFETRVIQAHAKAGQDLLEDIEFPCPVATAVGQHHERLDGSGYPQGLAGKYILLEARILAVADVVEAMSSARPHRRAYSLEEAMAEITAESGRLYDENVVTVCRSLFGGDYFQFGARRTVLPLVSFSSNMPA